MPDGRSRLYTNHSPGSGDPRKRPRLVSNSRGLKVFSLWNASGVDPTGAASPALTAHENIDCEVLPGDLVPSSMEGRDGPLGFMVNLWGLEVIRLASAPVAPLNRQQIYDAVLSGDPGAHRGSRYKMELAFGAQNLRRVDVGQSIRMSAVARYMNVACLFPESSFIEPTSDRTLGAGLVVDTIFGVEILAAYSPPGDRLATNSSTVVVLATILNTAIRLEPGCRRVTLIQTGLGAVMTPTFALDDLGAAGPNLGNIVLGADRRAVAVDVPGHATAILTGAADANNSRVLTVIQLLEI